LGNFRHPGDPDIATLQNITGPWTSLSEFASSKLIPDDAFLRPQIRCFCEKHSRGNGAVVHHLELIAR
jgi:hypothetical protein